ncbi:hypothetical protein KL86PLE_130058 [uncultured Pleomorphomonas sp.]|uniref:Uncharacterized protein n=1 Tax=uncultured Pleomorphomonas sp. TaxID=442121 RepID=A0A212L8Z7_9HYPH|nr:hypothetical protein KL86PLE_130058 [uncultured Pleomorphomonas sp.]
MGVIMAKVFPALAGAYIRNLFPPRKPWRQRLMETAGGVLIMFYAGEVAAGATWAVLKWAGGFVGVTNIAELVDRGQSDLLAAFLVGLTGMTAVEGGLHYLRQLTKKNNPYQLAAKYYIYS